MILRIVIVCHRYWYINRYTSYVLVNTCAHIFFLAHPVLTAPQWLPRWGNFPVVAGSCLAPNHIQDITKGSHAFKFFHIFGIFSDNSFVLANTSLLVSYSFYPI